MLPNSRYCGSPLLRLLNDSFAIAWEHSGYLFSRSEEEMTFVLAQKKGQRAMCGLSLKSKPICEKKDC